MSPLDVAVYIVRVFVGDAEVIVDVSFVVGASPSTASEGSDRIGIIKGPANTVDVVASLLHDSVTSEPGEVIPVLDLPFDVAHSIGTARCFRHSFDRTSVVDGVDALNITNRTVVDALE